MAAGTRVELAHVPAPSFGAPARPPAVGADELGRLCDETLRRAGTDWVVVHADREHAANLVFLTGFDPRFEEAALVLGPGGARTLLVGNEGVSYARIAPLACDVVLAQSFSLMGQDRTVAPRLDEVLRSLGLAAGASVGLVGWKHLEPTEVDDPSRPAFVPAMLVDAIARATERAPIDVTAVLMHPATGLRAINSADRIAAFEWAAVRSGEAVRRIVAGTRPGMTELEAAGLMGYEGEPLSAHVMLATGRDAIVGLRSPSAKPIERGDAATTAIGYWGGLSCRAGLVAHAADDAGFVERVVAPYFGAIATWYASVRLGVVGGEVHERVTRAFDGAGFGSMLNPGHQVSIEEWLHTAIRPGSVDVIASGNAYQVDIIPSPLAPGEALNCEDTVAIADASLRAELAERHPDVWDRIVARQAFLRDALGLDVADEVLPLSATPAHLAPFWLDPDIACVVRA
ncbi:MAG: hypothetical protein RLZZ272_1419 [Actinomycetota bacterium]